MIIAVADKNNPSFRLKALMVLYDRCGISYKIKELPSKITGKSPSMVIIDECSE